MGNKISTVLDKLKDLLSLFKTDKQVSLTILGLDAAGKTTLVNLLNNNTVSTVPTIGFNAEEITIDKTTIRLWDVGGQTTIINFWKEYVKNTDGLIFVIDIADTVRYTKAFEAFSQLTEHLKENIPVLLLLNKTDLIANNILKNEKIDEIRQIFNCDDIDGMIINNKKYKSRIIDCSVKNEQHNMITNPNYSIVSSNIYTGFRWVMKIADSKEQLY